MNNVAKAAQDFLSLRRVAVVGVSTTGSGAACAILRKLRAAGHEAYGVNLKGGTFDGAELYPDLAALPVRPEGVVIVTPAPAAIGVIKQGAALGVRSVWLHQGLGGEASSSPEAVECCRACGLDVIAGACPMMYCEPVDFFHKCARFIMRVTGKLPAVKSRPGTTSGP